MNIFDVHTTYCMQIQWFPTLKQIAEICELIAIPKFGIALGFVFCTQKSGNIMFFVEF